MRSFLEKLRFPWDERRRLLAAGLACLAGLVVALLLPLAFRTSPGSAETPSALTADEKALLFAAWWYDAGAGAEVEHIEAPEARTAAFCKARMAELSARCIDDRALGGPDVTGEEYVAVTGAAGTLRLCRMWLQARGDWQNWLDVCFDADTGLVYYLYLSRECLSNRSLYADAERPTAEVIAAELASEAGGTLRRFLDDGAGGGTALVARGDGTLCYTIGCTFYDALIDIRIGCV